MDRIPERAAYEGNGGWQDGRFGQAYDLICDALKERGVIDLYRHPLLAAIEMEDGNYEPSDDPNAKEG
ncbi:hypothetical protein [Sphingobium olei]|uniref:Uncharacterized protein n=1 Tax=Sphingobium olei TaxID=420955 RepID=A0ABW3NXT5_9SPHN